VAQMTFTRAARRAVKLKIGIQGPAGSGKTLGALHLAKGLAPNGRIALIDTENGSASLYADRFEFDTLRLDAPYESDRYIEALGTAVDAGYEVIIIDSLSHQWAGPGGILARKEEKDLRGGNHFTNWGEFSKEHSGFQATLLATPAHVIATFRTKQEYVVSEDGKGKHAPKKVGLAAVQREGFDYEFSLMFELQMDHKAGASKDRTGLFDGKLLDLRKPDIARELRTWLSSAAPAVEPAPAAAPIVAQSNGNGAPKSTAKGPPADEGQISRLLDLLANPAVPGLLAVDVEERLKRPLSARGADTMIGHLEGVIAGPNGESPSIGASSSAPDGLGIDDARRATPNAVTEGY